MRITDPTNSIKTITFGEKSSKSCLRIFKLYNFQNEREQSVIDITLTNDNQIECILRKVNGNKKVYHSSDNKSRFNHQILDFINFAFEKCSVY